MSIMGLYFIHSFRNRLNPHRGLKHLEWDVGVWARRSSESPESSSRIETASAFAAAEQTFRSESPESSSRIETIQ